MTSRTRQDDAHSDRPLRTPAPGTAEGASASPGEPAAEEAEHAPTGPAQSVSSRTVASEGDATRADASGTDGTGIGGIGIAAVGIDATDTGGIGIAAIDTYAAGIAVAPTDRTGADTLGAPVLVLLSADWAAPSRPAPTLLRELSRRWGASMRTLLVEDPDDALLDRWEIEHLPTWLRFLPASASAEDAPARTTNRAHVLAPGRAPAAGSGEESHAAAGKASAGPDAEEPEGRRPELHEDALHGRTPEGATVTLPGPWTLTHRRTGALPKHVVDAELGPLAH